MSTYITVMEDIHQMSFNMTSQSPLSSRIFSHSSTFNANPFFSILLNQFLRLSSNSSTFNTSPNFTSLLDQSLNFLFQIHFPVIFFRSPNYLSLSTLSNSEQNGDFFS